MRLIPPPKVLITGANGIIGSELLRLMILSGFDVVGTYRRTVSPNLQKLADDNACKLISCDLSKHAPLPENIDIIIHTATQIKENGHATFEYINNNTLMAKTLVDYAVRSHVKLFILFSSLSVYGEIKAPVVDENTEKRNVSLYGISKILSERILFDASEILPSISFRLPGVIGHGAKGVWLAKIIEKAKKNDTIEICHPDFLFNNSVHVSDLAKFIMTLVVNEINGADVLTLACASPLPIKDIVTNIIKYFRSTSSVVTKFPDKAPFSVSCEKAISVYRYEPSPLQKILNDFLKEN